MRFFYIYINLLPISGWALVSFWAIIGINFMYVNVGFNILPDCTAINMIIHSAINLDQH